MLKRETQPCYCSCPKKVFSIAAPVRTRKKKPAQRPPPFPLLPFLSSCRFFSAFSLFLFNFFFSTSAAPHKTLFLFLFFFSTSAALFETLFLFVHAASSYFSLQKGIITNPLIPILSSLFFPYSRAAFMLLNKHHFVSYMIAAPNVKNNHNINCILQTPTCNFLKNYSTCQLCGVINSPLVVETIRVLRCTLLV
jgi:hypothetical protein